MSKSLMGRKDPEGTKPNTSEPKHRGEPGRIGAEDKKISKLKVELPDGVNMRHPQTKKLIKDPEKDKALKAVQLEVPNDTFWKRRINAGDVKWLNAPEGYEYQKTHRIR